MKKCITVLLLLTLKLSSALCQSAVKYSIIPDPVMGYFYCNPFLYDRHISPMYYPSLTPNQVNIVTPLSFDLSSVRFEGLTLNPINLKNPSIINIQSYNSYATIAGGNIDLIQANHNLIVGDLQNAIVDKSIELGCKVTARITTDALRVWLKTKCLVPVTTPTAVACAAGLALENASVKGGTETIIKEGCKVTAKFVYEKVIELTIETYADLKQSLQEAMFWLGYLNSLDGMIWMANRFQH